MSHLLFFRVGAIANESAFEAMSLIYQCLQEKYGYQITIVKSEHDNYQNEAFKIVSISEKAWKVNKYLSLFLMPGLQDSSLRRMFAEADGIVTVDPTAYSQGLLGINEAQRAGKPVWLDTSITVPETRRDLMWKLQRRGILKALAQTTGIIATGPKCLERFQDLALLDEAIASKFTIMGHPADTQRFVLQAKLSARDGILRVLVVSRLVPEKGLLYILEAMTPLLRERNNLQLQLIGTGPLKSLLSREVSERALEDKVLFRNPVPHGELAEIIGSADLFVSHAVSTSGWEEYFGASNIEAMSCGLPCVLTSSGGTPYTVREKDVAVMVEDRNIIQLRTAIAQLLDSESERLEMGQRARNYVERYYAVATIAEKYHRMLQRGMALGITRTGAI